VIEKKIINIDDNEFLTILSSDDDIIGLIEKRFNSTLIFRGNEIIINGQPEEILNIEKIIMELIYILNKNKHFTVNDVDSVINLFDVNKIDVTEKLSLGDNIVIYNGFKNKVNAKSENQVKYYFSVKKNDIVFAVGPAGTGKTFLAVAMALEALKNNEIGRIILTRPAVEAGESLGFLPGDLNEKLDPYLRPLMDALQFMLSPEKLKNLREKNIIEINPLAYMRGRTLNNAVIILDEAQNTTAMQMKMFLTRLGRNSKAIITGDITQVDLQGHTKSGLVDANELLSDIKGIDFIYFDSSDVVRHRLVKEIINAYDKRDSKSKEKKK